MSEDEKRKIRLDTLEKLFPLPRSVFAWGCYQAQIMIFHSCNFAAMPPIKVIVYGKEVEL